MLTQLRGPIWSLEDRREYSFDFVNFCISILIFGTWNGILCDTQLLTGSHNSRCDPRLELHAKLEMPPIMPHTLDPGLGHVHMGSQGPSYAHASKSQYACKVPTYEAKKIVKYGQTIIKVGTLIISCKKLDPTVNTSSKPRLQKVIPCKHPCHTWDS